MISGSSVTQSDLVMAILPQTMKPFVFIFESVEGISTQSSAVGLLTTLPNSRNVTKMFIIRFAHKY
jgi:hypothetical protein